jgi:hypothetical protein
MIDNIEETWVNIFAKHIEGTTERSGVPATQWRSGGRRTKANPDGESLDFWRGEGLRQIDEYLAWFKKSGWSIATMPDGKPGIEWEAEVPFGGRPVRLIVDAIYQVGASLVVVDYKTGSRNPYGMIQAGLYASAIERVYGIRPKWGAFYMTRKAELSDLVDLSPWSMEFFDYEFAALNAFIETGFFPPNVGDHCSYCGVADACLAVNGRNASKYPLAIPHTKENSK